MRNPSTVEDLQQRIATKRAQREELEREIRNFQDTLNILLRDASRPDRRAMPSVLYEATEPDEPPPEPEHGYGLLPVLRVSPASLPQYKEWTISFRVIKAMIDVLLQERPLRRRVILQRLAALNQYQGGMCISGSLTMTERTPRHLISPLVTNRVGTDSAVLGYVHFTLALV